MTLKLYSWGYWGWGNYAADFVRLTDAVEKSRGFAPPFFVDVRIKRQGRAIDFNGARFEQIVGADRYRWMPALGNKAVADGVDGIEIAEPAAARELLDLAKKKMDENRRVVFFCACEAFVGYHRCHRREVAQLVEQRAATVKTAVHIEEWPGGTPAREVVRIPVARGWAKRALADNAGDFIPLADQSLPVELGALPWCTSAILDDGKDEARALVGPPRMYRDQWCITVLERVDARDRTNGRALAMRARKELAIE